MLSIQNINTTNSHFISLRMFRRFWSTISQPIKPHLFHANTDLMRLTTRSHFFRDSYSQPTKLQTQIFPLPLSTPSSYFLPQHTLWVNLTITPIPLSIPLRTTSPINYNKNRLRPNSINTTAFINISSNLARAVAHTSFIRPCQSLVLSLPPQFSFHPYPQG